MKTPILLGKLTVILFGNKSNFQLSSVSLYGNMLPKTTLFIIGLLTVPIIAVGGKPIRKQTVKPAKINCGIKHEDARVPVERITVKGKVHYVSLDGSGDFRSVQKAVNAARPGDKILVRPGVYRERIEFPRSGEPDKPIILEGEIGAILDGGNLIRGWKPAPEIGQDVYKKTNVPYSTAWSMNMTWNNKYILQLDHNKLSKETMFAALRMTKDSPPLKLGNFTYDRRWEGVKAYFATIDKKITYIRFGDGRDPNKEQVTCAPDMRGVVHLNGKSYIVIRGFTIRNGWSAITLFNGASDNVVEDNYLMGGHHTVFLRHGSARNHIRNNEITLNYVSEHLGIPSTRDRKLFAHIWRNFKCLSSADRVAINIASAGDGNQIYGNHIFKHWGGIQDLLHSRSDPTRTADNSCRGLNVYHNVIHNIHDDGLEADGGEINAEWHDNLVFDCGQNMRVKQTAKGPMYIYRNRFFHPISVGYGLDLFIHSPGTRAKAYVYHNTLSGWTGLVIARKGRNPPENTGMPNGWFINNILSSNSTVDISGVPVGHHVLRGFDYNYVNSTSRSRNGIFANKKTISYGPHNVEGSRLWKEPINPTLQLSKSSPARNKGIDLSKQWTVNGVTHGPLPGMKPGYFSGDKPDLGAVQYGKRFPRTAVVKYAPAKKHTLTTRKSSGKIPQKTK